MKIKQLLTVCLLGLSVTAVRGQANSIAVKLECIRSSKDDQAKIVYADEIMDLLKSSAFGEYDVSKPLKYLGYKRCTNAEAELFSWSFPMEGGLAYYNLIRFKDRSYTLIYRPGEKNTVAPYLFYDLLGFTSGKKPYFILFGWAQSGKSNKKALLIAQFKDDGMVNFNVPLMKRKNSASSSLAFEYAGEASMMLKYDKNGKRIIFDHLAPIDEKYRGYFMFYGPDGSYDGLVLSKGWWEYKEDIKK